MVVFVSVIIGSVLVHKHIEDKKEEENRRRYLEDPYIMVDYHPSIFDKSPCSVSISNLHISWRKVFVNLCLDHDPLMIAPPPRECGTRKVNEDFMEKLIK